MVLCIVEALDPDQQLESYSIPGDTAMANWPESYLDIVFQSPSTVTNWSSHTKFKFSRTYVSFKITVSLPGKCAKPVAIGTSTPNGFDTYEFFCSMSLLSIPCPDWLAGPRISLNNTSGSSSLKSVVLGFNVTDSRNLGTIKSTEYIHGSMKCSMATNSYELMLDIEGLSPTHFENWVKRFIVKKMDEKGTIHVVEAPAGFCGRPEFSTFDIPLSSGAPHPFTSTVYRCNTPLLTASCPGWFEGNWTYISSIGGSEYNVNKLAIHGERCCCK